MWRGRLEALSTQSGTGRSSSQTVKTLNAQQGGHPDAQRGHPKRPAMGARDGSTLMDAQ